VLWVLQCLWSALQIALLLVAADCSKANVLQVLLMLAVQRWPLQEPSVT
jgi:hypothetical protein